MVRPILHRKLSSDLENPSHLINTLETAMFKSMLPFSITSVMSRIRDANLAPRFRYTSALKDAFLNGDISSLQDFDNRGWVAGSGANVFVTNHDTERVGLHHLCYSLILSYSRSTKIRMETRSTTTLLTTPTLSPWFFPSLTRSGRLPSSLATAVSPILTQVHLTVVLVLARDPVVQMVGCASIDGLLSLAWLVSATTLAARL